LDFTAGVALEMGMRRVMLTGQLKMVYPAFQGKLPHHTQATKILQNAVHSNLIDPAA
jgi:hypothetical protein